MRLRGWLCHYSSLPTAVLHPFEKVVMQTARQTTGLIHCGSPIYFSINKIQFVYNAVLLNCCHICSAFQHLWAMFVCSFTVCLCLGKYFPRKLHLNWMYCLLWLASYCTGFGALEFFLKKCFCGRKWTACKIDLIK